jgi:hypothetical protein
VVERRVEICDQVRGGEVEFDLAEQFRPDESPELAGGEPLGGGSRARERFTLLPPPFGEEVVLVDPVLVGIA